MKKVTAIRASRVSTRKRIQYTARALIVVVSRVMWRYIPRRVGQQVSRVPHARHTSLEAKTSRGTNIHLISFPDNSQAACASDSVRCLAAGGKPADLEQVAGLRGAD